MLFCPCVSQGSISDFIDDIMESLAKEKGKDISNNAEFQRIARRDKKAFLNEECQEIEKNSRMEKTRDLFKKIRDTFHSVVTTGHSMASVVNE